MPSLTRASACRFALPGNIVMRRFVAETVLLDINAGRYYRLDGTAGDMLAALLAGPTLDAAAAELAGAGWETAESARADLHALAKELEATGLLRIATPVAA